MRPRTVALLACVATLLAAGCNTVSRHRLLTRFFDGVPPPRAARAAGEGSTALPSAGPARRAGLGEHGPYAARLCDACHQAGASNALVAPKDELCLRCHALPDPPFAHGPVAAGRCLACHDPHSSRYGRLLVADPPGLCFSCHERQVVSRIDGHAELDESCITCHDAHGSDTRYLLK